jgi:hypothetical protein
MEFDDGADTRERFAVPVHSDEAEHAVLDAVPLRRARRVVTDGDGYADLLGPSGLLHLPGPDPVAIRTSGVGGDQ